MILSSGTRARGLHNTIHNKTQSRHLTNTPAAEKQVEANTGAKTPTKQQPRSGVFLHYLHVRNIATTREPAQSTVQTNVNCLDSNERPGTSI